MQSSPSPSTFDPNRPDQSPRVKPPSRYLDWHASQTGPDGPPGYLSTMGQAADTQAATIRVSSTDGPVQNR